MLNAARRQRAENHFGAVTSRHGIRVRRTKDWMSSECDSENRRVFVPRVFSSGLHYLVALHEVGHLLARGADTRSEWEPDKPGDQLRIEAAAWAWAMNNADPEVVAGFTKSDWRCIGQCWISHAGRPW